MMSEINSSFFELKSNDQLLRWMDVHKFDSMLTRSLAHYVDIHLRNAEVDENLFNPFGFLSRDLSSVIYEQCPVIFSGSNSWSVKKYLQLHEFEDSYNRFCAHVNRLLGCINAESVLVVVVPEKDMFISDCRDELALYDALSKFVEMCAAFCKSKKCHFDFTTTLPVKKNVSDYKYPDSHLPFLYYESLFFRILGLLGNKYFGDHLKYKTCTFWGDLAKKFIPILDEKYDINVLDFSNTPELVSGNENFVEPLNSIEQYFINSNPLFDKSVLVLGDSHSSLYREKRLVYLLGNTFRQVDFKWKPFGYGCERIDKKYDLVIIEGSLRFLV